MLTHPRPDFQMELDANLVGFDAKSCARFLVVD
jgi:hypothetical protein